jgi:hypothetical protein
MEWRSRGCPRRCNGGAEAVLTDVIEEQRLSSQMSWGSRGCPYSCNRGIEAVLTDVIEE